MELHSEGGSRRLQDTHELLGNSWSERIDKDGNARCGRQQFAQQLQPFLPYFDAQIGNARQIPARPI